MKRVLVTGATGFVGRHTLAPLVARGYEVHAASSRAAAADEGRGVRWHACDLLHEGAGAALVAEVRPTHLLHLAWYAEPGKFWEAGVNRRWVRASAELFEAFARAGGRRAVASGTCAEYEWGHGDGVCKEGATRLSPATLYGACKLVAHDALATLAGASEMSAAWGRVFFLYGPHEHPARLVSSVVRALIRGERVRLTHGRQVRDFLHVADVAAAFVALLDSDVTGAVNVASGRPVALKDLIGRVADKLDGRALLDFGARDAPAGEPPVLVADAGRLTDEVGFRPRYDLDAGLDETVAWWRSFDAGGSC